jgi:hypothetical protein
VPPPVVAEKCDPAKDDPSCKIDMQVVETAERAAVDRELDKDDAFDAELDEATKPS